MNREIIIKNAAIDMIIYEKTKRVIASLGYSSDTKIYVKDKDLKLLVSDENNIDRIKKVLLENNINSTYVEIG